MRCGLRLGLAPRGEASQAETPFVNYTMLHDQDDDQQTLRKHTLQAQHSDKIIQADALLGYTHRNVMTVCSHAHSLR
jgi:hypothetical protein